MYEALELPPTPMADALIARSEAERDAELKAINDEAVARTAAAMLKYAEPVPSPLDAPLVFNRRALSMLAKVIAKDTNEATAPLHREIKTLRGELERLKQADSAKAKQLTALERKLGNVIHGS